MSYELMGKTIYKDDDTNVFLFESTDQPDLFIVSASSKDPAIDLLLPEKPFFQLGTYRHHKNKYYEAIGTGYFPELKEQIIVYKALYDIPAKLNIFARSLENFQEKFTYIKDE